MTREEREKAISRIKYLQKYADDNEYWWLRDFIETFNMAIEALEQEPCDKYIKEIDHLRKYIYKLETQIVEQEPDAIHNEREQAYMKGYEDASKRFRTEPCEDAISRQAVLDVIEREEFKGDAIAEIEKLPSVSTEKTGHWVGIDEEPHEDYECDKCGYVVSTFTANIEPHTEYKYCPNCGAKMGEDGDKD